MYGKPIIAGSILPAGMILLATLSLLFRHTLFLEKNPFLNAWIILVALAVYFLPRSRKTGRRSTLAALLIVVPLAFPGSFQSDFLSSDYHTNHYFVIGGLAFATLLLPGRRAPFLSQLLALVIATAAALPLLNYLYKVDITDSRIVFSYLSPGIAACLLLLSFIIMLEEPRKGFIAAISSDLTGAQVLRVLIPVTIFVPVLLGVLRRWLVDNRNLNGRFGTTVLLLVMILLMVAAIWYTAYLINKREIQKRQMARALRVSQLELEAIFSNAPDAVVVVDQGGNIVRWNKAAENIFGFTEHDVLGQPVSETILLPADHPAFDAAFAGLTDTATSQPKDLTLEMQGRLKNGSYVDISLRMAPYLLNDSVYVAGFIRNITEWKKAEARLNAFNEELSLQVKEKTKELENVLERLTDGFAGLDTEFRFTYINRRVSQILKMHPSELVGRKITELFPWIEKYDSYQDVLNAFKSQLYTTSINYFKPLDFYHENHIYPDKNGVTVFIRDVTEKRKAQEALRLSIMRYKTFIEEAVDPIFVYAPEKNRYTDVNRRAAELLGYEMEELLDIDPQATLEKGRLSAFADALQPGEPTRSEAILKKKNGTLVEVESATVKLPDGSILSFVRDISERKKAEQEMLRLNGELRRLGNYLQEVRESERVHIAREIHDELGQQMTVLKMDIMWLRRNMGAAPAGEQLAKIDDLAGQVNTAINTVRKIASELRPSLLDDIGLAAAMEWHLSEFSKRTGIGVKSRLSDTEQSLPDSVKTNIFRILQEALTNVARHSAADCVQVDFSVSDDLVELEIADNGRGFNPAGGNHKSLGLLGMRERAHMIGAEYDINSAPGKGTRVHVTYRL